MATIRKRFDRHGVARYQVQIRRESFPPVSKTFPHLKDAKAWIAEVEHAQNIGEFSWREAAKEITLPRALERDIDLPHELGPLST